MIDINPETLIDGAVLERAQQNVEAAERKLSEAKQTAAEADAAVSRAWDRAVATASAGGDALAMHEAHQGAVSRRDFAARLVGQYQKLLDGTKQERDQAHTLAHLGVMRKGKEIRLAAARAADVARGALAEAESLNRQGTQLIDFARAKGLTIRPAHTILNGPVLTEARELEIWSAQ